MIQNTDKTIPKFSMQELKQRAELLNKRYEKTGILDCFICLTPMKKIYDPIAKKVTGNLWEYRCDCFPKGIQLSIGGHIR